MSRLIGSSKRRMVSNTGQEISLNDFKSLPTIRFLIQKSRKYCTISTLTFRLVGRPLVAPHPTGEMG